MGISGLSWVSTRSPAGGLPRLLAALENGLASNSKMSVISRRRTRGVVLAGEVEELGHVIKRCRVSLACRKWTDHLFKIRLYFSAHWILTSQANVGMTWWTIEYGRVIYIFLTHHPGASTQVLDLVIKPVLMLEEGDPIPRVEMWLSIPCNQVYL